MFKNELLNGSFALHQNQPTKTKKREWISLFPVREPSEIFSFPPKISRTTLEQVTYDLDYGFSVLRLQTQIKTLRIREREMQTGIFILRPFTATREIISLYKEPKSKWSPVSGWLPENTSLRFCTRNSRLYWMALICLEFVLFLLNCFFLLFVKTTFKWIKGLSL